MNAQQPTPPRVRPPLRARLALWTSSKRALALVWSTDRGLSLGLMLATLLGGLLPPAVAWVGKHLVDAILQANTHFTAGVALSLDNPGVRAVLPWLILELALVTLLAANARLSGIWRSLLRARLGHRVNLLVLEKSLTLDLQHFEDSELYDRITQARREASQRPLSLIIRTLDGIQAGISLSTYVLMLAAFSPLAVLILIVAGLPSFIAEAKFAGDAFRLFKWRTPETREQAYLETVLAREDHVKEVKLFDLGRRLLDRYIQIFHVVYAEDRRLTWRRGLWGLGLGLVASLAFYGAYAWIALATVAGTITLGAMTMYLAIFRQGQSALSSLLSSVSGLYEDNLYLSNLYELLDLPIIAPPGTAKDPGPAPADGLRFEHVTFRYPGSDAIALDDVSFHIPAGHKLAIVGENGSGKTTLVKLLAGFYTPDSGKITFEGRDLRDWNPATFRRRIGVIFQDFVRYQMTVGDNIGAGDADAFDDEVRWREAADKGLASPFIADLPKGYATQLGRWFRDGRELSLGQWQKIALSRAFMRRDADILVLDEPTASMDAEAEVQVFDRFRALTEDQLAIVISHRFSTVRMADTIIVLDRGRVIEAGTHEALVARGGRYATLFSLQAEGYK